MSRLFNVIGFIVALVLFPIAAASQTCGTIGKQKYPRGAGPLEYFDTPGEACEYTAAHSGKPMKTSVEVKPRTDQVGRYNCVVKHLVNGQEHSTAYPFSITCETSPGVYSNLNGDICKPASGCGCRNGSSCCSGIGPGSNGGGPQGKGQGNDDVVGDPVSVAQGYNYNIEVDWKSPKTVL